MAKEVIKDWRGAVIGSIEESSNGDKVIKDFYNRVLGKYRKNLNATFDFYGRQIGKGDQLLRLLNTKSK